MFNELLKVINTVGLSKSKEFYFLIFLLLISSTFELLTVLSIIPFMTLVSQVDTNFDFFTQFNLVEKLFNISKDFFIFYAGLAVLIIFVLNNLLLIFLTWRINFFIQNLGADLYTNLYSLYLNKNYSYHVKNSSNSLTEKILQEANRVISNVILQFLFLIGKSITIIFIVSTLLVINFYVTLIGITVIGSCYFFIYLFLKPIFIQNGKNISLSFKGKIKYLSEGFGGIRDIIINDLKSYFIESIDKSNKIFAKANALNVILNVSPRFTIDIISFGSVLVLILYLVSLGQGFSDIIVMLSLFTIAGYKLIPSFQQIYSSLSNIRSHMIAYKNIENDLKQINSKKNIRSSPRSLTFNKSIKFKSIKFSFDNRNFFIKDMSFTLNKNKIISFIGESGSGKSTVLDIISGLQIPTNIEYFVDDKKLKLMPLHKYDNLISYLSQNFFILNSTILENITLHNDKKKVNFNKLNSIIKDLNLESFIAKQSLGFDTLVGERGIMLSGGQRQRIAIARCLYKDSEIIIFDEVSSALDSKNEDLVIKILNKVKQKKIILVSTHSEKMIRNSDYLYKLKDGNIVIQGHPEKILN
jgi:ABC-type multidrug transport system fused ATPase/permease subunit